MNQRTTVHGLLLSLALATCGTDGKASEIPIATIADQKILATMPGTAYKLPTKIYTDEFLKGIKEKKYPSLIGGRADRAPKWIAIPESRWRELISDFAPVNGAGCNVWAGGRCPFTGSAFYRGATMTEQEFLKTPFQARTIEGNHIIYAREPDMPAEYRWRPNHTERIPHLDGTIHTYRFYVPEKDTNAPPTFNSARKNWLCPAGEVWRCRLGVIMRTVIPDLMAAVFHDRNAKAARALAVILDRIAEVYPGLPLYSQAMGHGFARERDGKGYLTRKGYLSVANEIPFRNWEHKPFWFHSIYDYNYAKLNYGISSWTDGVMDQLGMYGQAIELADGHAATRAYSREKYGDDNVWLARMHTRILKEAEYLALVNPPTLGNTSYGYIKGGVLLGIAAQNAFIFGRSLGIVEMYVPNNWYADGMPNDGAFNYAAMTYGIISYRWMNKLFGGLDLKDRYPILATVERLTYRPVRTLLNVGSKHGDQHARFFISRRPWMGNPEPGKLPYAEHEASQCFPIYGLTCLRAGRPGSRLEMIFDHQNTSNHVHLSRLNLQLFYEGVDLLPDFGYSVGAINPAEEPWRSVKYPFELLAPTDQRDKWGPWRYGYAMLPEAHCVALVDHWLYNSTPTKLHAYAGGTSLADDPGYWAQFVDASARGVFADRPNPVDIFRRQLVVLTLPDGRSAVVDLFRIRGGQRHELFWHVPSDLAGSTLGRAKPITAPNLQKYFDLRSHYEKLTGKTVQHYGRAGGEIGSLVSYRMPEGVWRADYLIQPHKFLPSGEKALKRYGTWPKLLHDVHLRLWGSRFGSAVKQEEMIGARGPWPGILDEVDPGTSKHTTNAMVGFKDALNFLIHSRVAANPGLESTFVHVLEPRNPDQRPALADVRVLDHQPVARGGGVTCRLELGTGGEAIVATTLNGETYKTAALTLKGRLGVACPEAGRLALYDGTHFSAGGWGVSLGPTWRMKLDSVIGDLTGDPSQSALIVQSDRALPIDKTLVGQMLFVNHRAGKPYRTGYTIARVSPFRRGHWRIDLANTAPFIQQRMRIWKIDSKDPSVLYQDFRFYKGGGKTNYEGRRVHFLRSGHNAAMESGDAKTMKLKMAAPAGAVKPGDAFIVYTIQPGDEVVIPSRFACRGRQEQGMLKLDLAATGPVTLHIPGPYTQASFGRAVRHRDALEVTLGAAEVTDGRASLVLTK